MNNPEFELLVYLITSAKALPEDLHVMVQSD